MHRHLRTATSRVGLATLVAGIALSLTFVGAAPAQASASGDRATTPPAATPGTLDRAPVVVYRTSIPKWVPGPVDKLGRPKPTPNANVDWQWLKAGWEIKFNWAETRQMSRGFSYCTVVAALLPTGISQGVAAACGILWIVADNAVDKRRCVRVFLPLSMLNPSIGTWSCPT